jgi:hypothetical protein
MLRPSPSSSSRSRSAARAQRAHENAKFRTAIQTIVSDLDHDPVRRHEMALIYQKYQVKRRRLYDIVNVFLALGCATRVGIDELVWHGRSRIFTELREEKNRLGIDNGHNSLSKLFPSETCVGLTSLTRSFLLLFGALRLEILDLRNVSAFFSRNTGRYKSTLCKLYQIALILGALGIAERTENACEVKILPPFTGLLVSEDEGNPLAIAKLLNRPIERMVSAEERRKEFESNDG